MIENGRTTESKRKTVAEKDILLGIIIERECDIEIGRERERERERVEMERKR